MTAPVPGRNKDGLLSAQCRYCNKLKWGMRSRRSGRRTGKDRLGMGLG